MIAQLDKNYIQKRPFKLFTRLISYSLFEGRPLTTRGRWINPLIFFLFALEKKLPSLRKVEKPVFILGTGRSGTTILGVLLSMHKQVGFLNEPKAMWHSIYRNEDLIGSYSSQKACYRLDEHHVSEEVVRRAHRLFGAYLTAVCSRRVVDKYPELVFRVPFVKSIFPDAKFLFLVRDGWETCNSIEKWSRKFGTTVSHESHNWWGRDNRKWHLLLEQVVKPDPYYHDIIDTINSFTEHIDMAMVEWVATMREGLKVMKQYPDDVLLVRFEDLTGKTSECLCNILEFVDLPEDEVMSSYADQTIGKVRSHDRAVFHQDILPLFQETMSELGYSG